MTQKGFDFSKSPPKIDSPNAIFHCAASTPQSLPSSSNHVTKARLANNMNRLLPRHTYGKYRSRSELECLAPENKAPLYIPGAHCRWQSNATFQPHAILYNSRTQASQYVSYRLKKPNSSRSTP